MHGMFITPAKLLQKLLPGIGVVPYPKFLKERKQQRKKICGTGLGNGLSMQKGKCYRRL